MNPTYTALAFTTLASNTSIVSFSNLPTSGFRDLLIVINFTAPSACRLFMNYNNQTTAPNNSAQIRWFGTNGTTAYSELSAEGALISVVTGNQVSTTGRNLAEITLPNYRSSTAKMALTRFSSNSSVELLSSRRSLISQEQSEPLTSVRFFLGNSTDTVGAVSPVTLFQAGSTFGIYGLAG